MPARPMATGRYGCRNPKLRNLGLTPNASCCPAIQRVLSLGDSRLPAQGQETRMRPTQLIALIRPHSLSMIYSAGTKTSGEDFKKFPPTFLLAATWDRGAANDSAKLFLEMNQPGGGV